MKVFCSFSSVLTQHLDAAGIEHTDAPDVACAFGWPADERELQGVIANQAATTTPFPTLTLLDKRVVAQEFAKVGLDQLPSAPLVNESSLDGFSPFILKPAIGMGSVAYMPLTYRIFSSKSEFLAAVSEECPDFWQLHQAAAEKDKLMIQKAVADKNESVLLTLISGYVNGKGDIIYLPSVENFQEDGHPVRTDDTPLDAASELALKDAVKAVLDANKVRNTPFMMQFVRKPGGAFHPIDFSYRTPYEAIGPMLFKNRQFCIDLVRFALDLQSTVTVPSDIEPHLRRINMNAHAKGIQALCKKHDVYGLRGEFREDKIIRAPKREHVSFVAFRTSKQEAKEAMDAFEAEVTTL